jgi:acylphosphatase
VQGVGFRYTTKSIASQYSVKGYVKNLPDGRVEVVVEGEAGEVGRFIAEIRRTMVGHVSEVEITESQPTGEFGHFSIRH